jgi:hypothetical protein
MYNTLYNTVLYQCIIQTHISSYNKQYIEYTYLIKA